MSLVSACEDDADTAAVLLAVVVEDRATDLLYKTGEGFVLETVIWPAVWGTRSHFRRDLTLDETRAWIVGHGITEVDL